MASDELTPVETAIARAVASALTKLDVHVDAHPAPLPEVWVRCCDESDQEKLAEQLRRTGRDVTLVSTL